MVIATTEFVRPPQISLSLVAPDQRVLMASPGVASHPLHDLTHDLTASLRNCLLSAQLPQRHSFWVMQACKNSFVIALMNWQKPVKLVYNWGLVHPTICMPSKTRSLLVAKATYKYAFRIQDASLWRGNLCLLCHANSLYVRKTRQDCYMLSCNGYFEWTHAFFFYG